MKVALAFLVLGILFLCWKFVFTSEELDFTDRAKVLQGLSLSLDYKKAVRDDWKTSGKLPDSEQWREDAVTVDISQSIVGAIRVGEDGPGVISVHYTGKPGFEVPPGVAGTRIMLIPRVQGERLIWDCRGTVPEAFLPRNCTPVKSPADEAQTQKQDR